MGRDANKHIRVTEQTWKELNRRKEPGDSFEDVIQRMLQQADNGGESEQGNLKTTATAD